MPLPSDDPLPRADALSVGMNPEQLSLAAQALADEVASGRVSAASLLVARGGHVVLHAGFGADADAVYGALVGDTDLRAALPDNPMSADRVRWEHIQRVYEMCDRNVSETARRLSMHRRTLQRILAKRSPK